MADHNKLIALAAKTGLAPIGLKRHGKSRLWYDDHGWWCIIVEFQPSSWSKGTYLNVGVCWLLYEKGHWTFDVGHRDQGFSPVRSDEQFSVEVTRMVTRARERVEHYREKFSSIDRAHEHYQSVDLSGNWDYYYAGVVAALAGDRTAARRNFEWLISQPRESPWRVGLYYRAVELTRVLENRRFFLDSITGIVHRTRTQILLDDQSAADVGLPQD
jgi:hypothetical protein